MERRGDKRPHAKLTAAEVRAIRSRRQEGETLRALAAAFGVHPTTVRTICAGRTWKRLG